MAARRGLRAYEWIGALPAQVLSRQLLRPSLRRQLLRFLNPERGRTDVTAERSGHGSGTGVRAQAGRRGLVLARAYAPGCSWPRALTPAPCHERLVQLRALRLPAPVAIW